MYLPFLSESLASPSCLTALVCETGYRSHPITRLLDFLPTVYAPRGVQKLAQKSTLKRECRQTARKNHKEWAVWRSGETFLKESAPCCQIFSFFSCLFFPCCHSGFLSAVQREAWRSEAAWVRKRQEQLINVSLGRTCLCFYIHTIYEVEVNSNISKL